ncbi:hypothetical protein IU412_26075, partial [Nocardia cyriacigeorgica]|nr:hypothetical protein [Nocardia cyriacigeorgica]
MSDVTLWEYATVPLLTHATKQILDQWGADGWERSNDQNLWIPGGRAFPEDDRRSHRILIKTSVGALAGRHARAHG